MSDKPVEETPVEQAAPDLQIDMEAVEGMEEGRPEGDMELDMGDMSEVNQSAVDRMEMEMQMSEAA